MARPLLLLTIAAVVVTFLSNTARAQTGAVAFSQSTYTVYSDQSNAPIAIIFTGSTDDTADVEFNTSNETATAGVNYVGVSTNLDFTPVILTNSDIITTNTVTTNTVIITIQGGGAPQSTQTVNLALSTPSGEAVLGSPSTAVLDIINTNEGQQVGFAQATFTADDTDAEAFVTLVLTGGTNGIITVNFNTSDGSAKAGTNYTATSTNVTFSDGMLTNTVDIPLLPPPSSVCPSNQTVNLALSSPTGGATLGSLSNAILTIQTTAPPVIQFSAASYSVHEHTGKATVTVIRACGDTSAQVAVDYATSDGTASNGVDYLSTNGTLIFGTNQSSQSFSFTIHKFSTFQSNKTVNVTLSHPVGATLGTPDTAVVTIVNDRPQTVIFTNSSGDVITLMLRSIGTMQVLQQEPLDLVLSETEAATKITMKVKSSKTAAALPQIDQITGDGDCGLIDARGFDVVGAGVQLDGYLKQLRIHDLTNDAVVTSNGAENQSTSIFAHNLEDGCAIIVSNRIGSLQAARFGNGSTIIAPQISAVSIKGDKKGGISGDCGGIIMISGEGLAANQLALGSLVVAGTISNTSIIISNGSASTVSASQMIDSTVHLGYTPNPPTNSITSGGTFVAGMRLGSVNIRSSTDGFNNSDIAASQIGDVHLASVVTDNGGLSFGVTAQQISGASCKTPPFHFAPNGPNDQSLGDFHVVLQ
ncbi:MAG: Calx-beta domain-containing protein [Verrucomicrobiia bacterium]